MSGWYWPFIIGLNLFVWTGLSTKAINWALKPLYRSTAEKRAENEWLKAVLYAQYERNVVLEAEIYCVEALSDGDR